MIEKETNENTICVKVTGITELNKKKVFIVIAKDLPEAFYKAKKHTFKNTKLKVVKTIINLEVIADVDTNNLLL